MTTTMLKTVAFTQPLTAHHEGPPRALLPWSPPVSCALRSALLAPTRSPLPTPASTPPRSWPHPSTLANSTPTPARPCRGGRCGSVSSCGAEQPEGEAAEGSATGPWSRARAGQGGARARSTSSWTTRGNSQVLGDGRVQLAPPGHPAQTDDRGDHARGPSAGVVLNGKPRQGSGQPTHVEGHP